MPASDLIRVPDFAGSPRVLDRIEAAIDDALRSANPVLNFVLAPVRDFVADVLHPVIGWADAILGWGWSWVSWGWDRLFDLAVDAGSAANWVFDTVTAWAADAVNGVYQWASSAVDQLAHWASDAVNGVYSWASSAIDQLTWWATDAINALSAWAASAVDQLGAWASDAINGVYSWASSAIDQLAAWASDAVDGLRSFTEAAVRDLQQWAADAVDGLRSFTEAAVRDLQQWAADALAVLRRDIIDPLAGAVDQLGHDFYGFLDAEWRWVKKAERWIVWTTEHVIQEAVDTWTALRDFDPAGALEAAATYLADHGEAVWAESARLVP